MLLFEWVRQHFLFTPDNTDDSVIQSASSDEDQVNINNFLRCHLRNHVKVKEIFATRAMEINYIEGDLRPYLTKIFD